MRALSCFCLDDRLRSSELRARVRCLADCAQAHERLIAMNDPEKGGSAYLQQKIANARDALVDAPAAEEPPKE